MQHSRTPGPLPEHHVPVICTDFSPLLVDTDVRLGYIPLVTTIGMPYFEILLNSCDGNNII
jgi:hypothetical protein